MKKFFIFLAALVVLLAAGAYALTRFISVEAISQQVVAKVKEETGRDLSFDRPRLAFVPSIGLRVQNVKLGNPAWAKEKTMLALEEVTLNLALKELFNKRVEITRFNLRKPVIHLEVAADGRKSWDFPKKAKDGDKAGKGGGAGGDGVASGFAYKFGQMQMDRAQVTYADARSGAREVLEDVSLILVWPDFESDLSLDGKVKYKGQDVNFVVTAAKPMDIANGKPSDVDLRVEGAGAKLSAKGKLGTFGTNFWGKVSANADSLSKLAGWLGGGKAASLPFEKLAFSGNASGSTSVIKVENASLDLDDVKAAGNVTIKLQGRPHIGAKLALNHLDLDRFTAASKGAPAGEKPAAPKEARDWDATPMNFAGLKSADADLVLETKGFTVKGADVGPSTLTVALKDGNLRAKSSEAALFGGSFSSDLTVNASGATPALALKLNMEGVKAKPMLTAFADFEKLDGTAFATLDVSSAGNSQKAIIGNLKGGGNFNFKDGAVEGIDLVRIAKMIQTRLSEMNIGEGKTEFVDLGGTFTVANGVARNEDMKMRGPLVQATGSGAVDLPQKRVDYRVLPVLTASSAVEGAKGLTVPVDIRGPFSKIKVKPDYKSMVKNVLDNPDDAKAVIKNVREEGSAILKDLKKDPNKALGRLLGIPEPEPAPETAPAPEAAPAPAAETAPGAETPAPAPPAEAPADPSPAPVDAAPAP